MSDKPGKTPFPTKDQILEFVRDSDGPVGKREIARAFGIRGQDRARLNDILRELRAEGELDRGKGRRFAKPGVLPRVTVIEVTGTDRDGDPIARPTGWEGPGEAPKIYLQENAGRPAPGIGDRVLARLNPEGDGTYTARTIKKLDSAPRRILGFYRIVGDSGRIIPTSRRIKTEFHVAAENNGNATPGNLVEAQSVSGRYFGLPEAKIVTVIGSARDARASSLIAIHAHDIPVDFTPEATRDAEAAKPVSPNGRVDLRDIPLVTIDGADARDFDDAVWAEADTDAANKGGWKLVVAIADVASYVTPGSALDKCAYERGNSVYFPDRVVPMLPEALSNGLCSLVPEEDRGCLAARMRISSDGRLLDHQFVRGIMRSAARLTYEQVQAARDGQPDETTTPLLDTVVTPLYGAFEALLSARKARGTVDLDLPERRVKVDDRGHVVSIETLDRLDSHRLIEEFMITANVAAAETLDRKSAPCIFRVHDQPSVEKMESLRETLAPMGIRIAKGQVFKPALFQKIVSEANGTPEAPMINMAVLRSQSQAEYSPANIGHFGLALRRYAHFTSPIRRYSDLLVHRSLVTLLHLGKDGLGPQDGDRFAEMGKQVSFTERRAVDAEREAVDRFTTIFLSKQIGAEFSARINGTHRAGLFITLEETGADGLIPMSLLGQDRFDFVTRSNQIKGRETGTVFSLGNIITARLEEANVDTGSLLFSVVEKNRKSGKSAGERPRQGKRGRKKLPSRQKRVRNSRK